MADARTPGDALPWTLFGASLAGLALLVAWSVRHPVRAVAPAPIVAAEGPAAEPAPARERVEVVADPDPVPGVVVAATGGGGVEVGGAGLGAGLGAGANRPTVAEPVALAGSTRDAPAGDGPAMDGPITGGADGGAPGDAVDAVPDGAVLDEGVLDGGVPDDVAVPVPVPVPDVATLRRDEELATLAGLSARLRYAPGETVPGATGAAALERMVEPLARHSGLDVVVSVTGREADASPAEDRTLARARAAHVVDRFVEAGLGRGRFLIRIEPDAGEPRASGHRVRVTALVDGA